MIGQTVSHYRVIEKLGQGGMGVVYKAEDSKLNRTVALKFLPDTMLGGEEERIRFVREAQSAAALQHPNICTVYEIDDPGGRTFISMAYIEGRNVKEMIGERPLPLDVTVDIGTQVAQGLQEAHEKGVVHRDVKSANVMVTNKGRAIIMDFGLSKQHGQTAVTQAGASMGTIDYMSPEQAQGGEIDHRTDIWSLGVMLYEMVAGRVPFRGERVQAVIYAILNEQFEPLTAVRTGVPMELERIVKKAMAKNPSERYQHLSDMLVDLRSVQAEVGIPETSGMSQTWAGRSAVSTASSETTFFKKLFSRRALQTLGAYAVFALGLLLLLEWLVNKFPLSPHLPRFGLFALLALVPTVLQWGSLRGRPAGASAGAIKSLGIPVSLLLAGAALFFGFQNRDLGAATTTLQLSDDQGKTVERVVPKGAFRKRIALFHFDNKGGDPENDWLQYGVTHLLRYDLYQDMYVSAGYGFNAKQKKAGFVDGVGSPLTLKRKIAKEGDYAYFLAGTCAKENGVVKLQSMLHETKSGKTVAKREFVGADLFQLLDSLSVQLRYDLEIPDYHIRDSRDLPVAEVFSNSEDAVRNYALGVAARRRNDYQSAASYLNQSVEDDPAFAASFWALNTTHRALNQGAEAEQALRMALQHKYKFPERIQLEFMNSYYARQEDSGAMFENAKRWVSLYPGEAGGHVALAQHFDRTKDFDAAIVSRKRVLEVDPEEYGQLLEIAELHEKQGDFEDALNYYEQYADLFPEKYESFTRIGGLYNSLGDYDRAREYFKKALVIDPEQMSVRMGLADFDRNQGKFDAALEKCKEALAHANSAEDSSTAYVMHAIHHLLRGQAQQALGEYETFIDLLSKVRSPVDVIFTRLFTMNFYAEANKTDLALAKLREIEEQPMIQELKSLISVGYLIVYFTAQDKKHIPDATKRLADFEEWVERTNTKQLDWAVVYCRGGVQGLQGDTEGALESLQKTLDLAPQNEKDAIMRANVYSGMCCRELGKFELGQAYFDAALQLSPFDALANYELAKLYYDMGQKDAAFKHLNRALDVWKDADKDYRLAKEARTTLAEWKSSI